MLFSRKKSSSHAEVFRTRYAAFRELLAANNDVLELMADMEEKQSGEFLLDRNYIVSNIGKIAELITRIIKDLNLISGGKYDLLNEKLINIKKQLESILARKTEIPQCSYIIPFDKINKEMADRLGGKNANLGEVRNRVALPTPDGFAISTYAFKRFMDHNDFRGRIFEIISRLSPENLEELNKAGNEIQEMIAKADMPADLKEQIERQVESMVRNQAVAPGFSVRSSALHEDGDFSFAGQYSTFLNVEAEDVVQKYKEVIASLFTSRAIFYFMTKGLNEYDLVMSAGVLRMIDARAAGVIYSQDPTDSKNDTVIVSSVHGLGKSLVDGIVTPETYIVSKRGDLEIIGRKIPEQGVVLVCSENGSIKESSLPEKRCQSLNDDEIKKLAAYALQIENHYKFPQDAEWAIGRDGKIYILQTRPLRVISSEPPRPIPTRLPGYPVLIDRGIIACKGIGYGRVHLVKSDSDLNDFPDGAVLVAKHTSPKYVSVMNKASAIVTDFGGATGHMASLAREFQIPAVLDTESATEILKDVVDVTVDAFNCNVYKGKVPELIELAGKRQEPFKETQILKTLQKVLKLIVPLNLADPESKSFMPDLCETLHDITRFCHETAMHEMFKISGVSSDEIGETRKLIAGIPLVSYIIDLGDGIVENAPKVLNPEHLASGPMKAFFRGLVDSNWPQAKPIDAGGFLGMLAHTATIPEEELRRTGEKSFSFISENYMNFLLRLGYHLSTVEAFAGENLNDNYIRFFFKGGGAAEDRRLRRVRLICEILKSMDFRVKAVDDVVDAMITKYKKPMIEEKLEILGRLTVFTKQLDMVMYNDQITDFYIQDFIRKHINKAAAALAK